MGFRSKKLSAIHRPAKRVTKAGKRGSRFFNFNHSRKGRLAPEDPEALRFIFVIK